MNVLRKTGWVLASALLVLAAPAAAPSGGGIRTRQELLSRLEAMGHGYHTQAEWDALFADVERLSQNSARAGDWNSLVELQVIKATVFSDMLRDHEQALAILQDARQRYGHLQAPALRKVFVRMADVYARLGDEAAINRLIAEFKTSAVYDAERYPYSGGKGRGVPLVLTRPSAAGEGSVSVSMMEQARRRARFAPGRAMPDFEAAGRLGGSLRLSDYRGRVVLVDFWMRGWEPWRRDLPNLVSLYRSHHASGFEIVGFNLERSAGDLDAFLAAYSMEWPQAVGDAALCGKLGVHGEAANFLVDRNGVIVGTNLRGSELARALRAALGIE